MGGFHRDLLWLKLLTVTSKWDTVDTANRVTEGRRGQEFLLFKVSRQHLGSSVMVSLLVEPSLTLLSASPTSSPTNLDWSWFGFSQLNTAVFVPSGDVCVGPGAVCSR